MCEGSDLLGLKDSTLFCLFCTYQQILLLIGSTWGLMVEMALYVDLTNKENHSDPWDWPNCLNNMVFFHWHLPFQSYETSGFQTSGYVTAGLSYKLKINHHFRDFFIGGVLTDRTGSILKAGLQLGLDCGLWAIWPVSMEMTYQLENQTPLDGRTPGLVPRFSIT